MTINIYEIVGIIIMITFAVAVILNILKSLIINNVMKLDISID